MVVAVGLIPFRSFLLWLLLLTLAIHTVVGFLTLCPTTSTSFQQQQQQQQQRRLPRKLPSSSRATNSRGDDPAIVTASPSTTTTTTTTSKKEENDKRKQVTCDFCHSEFPSRNAFFRHLRMDSCTSDNPQSPGNRTDDPFVKQSIAILFGYVPITNTEAADDSPLVPPPPPPPINEWAGQQILHTIQQALDHHDQQRKRDNKMPLLDLKLFEKKRTQSSVARLRARIVQQDPDCAAATDVLVVTGSCRLSSLSQLQDVLQELPDTVSAVSSDQQQHALIRLWACKLLHADVSLHAERSCTQMVYHYLVPFAWMPDADRLLTEWKGWTESPPTDCLKRFKQALKGAQSRMVSSKKTNPGSTNATLSNASITTTSSQQQQQQQQNYTPKLATGRFRSLAYKEKKAWHNFADPKLRGQAAPNQETVWRVVDFCQMVDFVNFGKPNAAFVVEIKGDAFLPQQVRRIVGTAIAMTHGWIPSNNAWETVLLNPTTVQETILAPPGRVYLADCRFHFEESRSLGFPLFDSDIEGKVLDMGGRNTDQDPRKWTQEFLMNSRATEETRRAERQWLEDVRDRIAPRVRASMQRSLLQESPFFDEPGTVNLDPAPEVYRDVLTKLRDIVATERWPNTSVARSNVIRNAGNGHGISGSFTVINTKLKEKLQSSGGVSVDTPLANELFPDLAKVVFELEELIANQAKKVEVDASGDIMVSGVESSLQRSQSTHCAVNANALFEPHVDSGRGAGQSLSLIVGLGDYTGGELFVEGLPSDIRFKPLGFDGWALRHWTNYYQGERFSLVWFTPELT
jgi:tRNA U38,U39,U40 pseudouridine synthase TruA